MASKQQKNKKMALRQSPDSLDTVGSTGVEPVTSTMLQQRSNISRKRCC